ncbi:MAG: thioredoxin domain-containing protein [Actinomycetes bacterium]
MNRLAGATSPYLLAHQENPVDWYEWGPEAFAAARQLDRPLLISVGYAACHWCHVMAHESFEDPTTATFMNEHFVNVKVDREERPDVDAVLMEATQAMTGQGGWPMTVIATPAGTPFYCGTYFPPTPRHGMPGFPQVLAALATSWRERRGDVLGAAEVVARQLGARRAPVAGAPPAPEELDAAVVGLTGSYDPVRGGFGGAPKFPPSTTMEHLLRHHARTGSAAALDMVAGTARAMAHGGIYDQLAGGFARYSVDAGWVVPHFEKMLYDNALLLRSYLHWWRATGDPLGRRVARETAGFLLAELRTAENGFASSLDADSDGGEGTYYVWTPGQLRAALGEEDGRWVAARCAVTAAGTFERGTSVLQLAQEPDGPTEQDRWTRARTRLAAVRNGRVHPGRDDKVVTAWNGLAIAALAEAGMLLNQEVLLRAARDAADLLLRVHRRPDGRLVRASRDGVAGSPPAVLEDYADLAEGLLALYAATADPSWLQVAGQLLDVALADFRDADGTFYDAATPAVAPGVGSPSEGVPPLVRRPQDATDSPTPSGVSALAGALLGYAAYTGSEAHRHAAEAALGMVTPLVRQHPRSLGWGLAVAEALADGPREVAVLGPIGDRARGVLHRIALAGTAPGVVVAVGPYGSDLEQPGCPLLADRPGAAGPATAYICRHFSCLAPTTDPQVLAAGVGAHPSVTGTFGPVGEGSADLP